MILYVLKKKKGFKAFSNLEKLYLNGNMINDFVATKGTQAVKIYAHGFKSNTSFKQ